VNDIYANTNLIIVVHEGGKLNIFRKEEKDGEDANEKFGDGWEV